VILVAGLYLLLTNKKSFRIDNKQIPALVYIALLGTLFADVLYFFALTKISVVNAVVIGHMQPIFIVLFSFVFLKSDRLSFFDYLGIVVMMISALMVTTQTLDNLFSFRFGTIGDIMVVAATIAWATTAIAMRKFLSDMHAGSITLYRFLFSSIFFIPYLLIVSDLGTVNIYQIVVGFVVGVGTICYYEGLKRMKAAQVSGLELSTPFFAAVLAFIILGEKITILQILGVFLLFAGIICFSKKEYDVVGVVNE